MKDVIIGIKSTQGLEDNENVIELTTEGKLSKKGGDFFLSYDESEMLGEKSVKTVLQIKDNGTVVLERTGGMSSRLVVQEGVRNNCFYSTPHGDMMIGIFGEYLKSSLSDTGGGLTLCYSIDSNLQTISKNKVEITVREVQKNVNNRS